MTARIKLGVMQGRLLRKHSNKYQFFPKASWQKEFFYAKKYGLNYIEFIFGDETINNHPLLTPKGLLKIIDLEKKSGIKVRSVCADYFMYNPLFKKSIKNKIIILKKLILNCKILGVTDIVIPFVDNSSLKSELNRKKIIKIFNSLSKFIDRAGVNIALETDLPPKKFLSFIKLFKSKKIAINYDLGNSAYKGFNINEEFRIYGNKISSIHIKDRVVGGFSVPLGKGDVNFNDFFKCIKKYMQKRDIYFIFQCYRDDEGVKVFKKQLLFFKKKMNRNLY